MLHVTLSCCISWLMVLYLIPNGKYSELERWVSTAFGISPNELGLWPCQLIWLELSKIARNEEEQG